MEQPTATAVPTVTVGDIVAGHRVDAVLGRGGMGQVFVAHHPSIGRCALKAAPADSPMGPGSTDVRREAALMTALRHPRIVRPFGSGRAVTAAGHHLTWMTMPQIPGVDLTRAGRLRAGEVLDVARQIADALDHIHTAGIIHCDVKAANIMVERTPTGRIGGATLIDFGIARYWLRAPGPADPSFVGTLTTAPPEALRGELCGPRSDQYGLACTVYTMLAGFPPFLDDGTLQSALAARRFRAPEPLGAVDSALAGFDAVLRRALASDPADRFGSCGEFVRALNSRVVPRAATRPWIDTAPIAMSHATQLRLPQTLIPA
ncbi:serine/threonine protein kinase [Gordonia sp. TBRC 11910]|uniref:non-specific serine/threonine protein kinase n=1 Tax=Gordonia asplenii TaxID=2725283 RepID=A0A848L0Z8_9ACTN|nr:serine/threonine-protein kinase [Gordonia asplenii]NMO04554.1 serine/threonine protein kinase [Gordonia asplenii]